MTNSINPVFNSEEEGSGDDNGFGDPFATTGSEDKFMALGHRDPLADLPLTSFINLPLKNPVDNQPPALFPVPVGHSQMRGVEKQLVIPGPLAFHQQQQDRTGDGEKQKNRGGDGKSEGKREEAKTAREKHQEQPLAEEGNEADEFGVPAVTMYAWQIFQEVAASAIAKSSVERSREIQSMLAACGGNLIPFHDKLRSFCSKLKNGVPELELTSVTFSSQFRQNLQKWLVNKKRVGRPRTDGSRCRKKPTVLQLEDRIHKLEMDQQKLQSFMFRSIQEIQTKLQLVEKNQKQLLGKEEVSR